MQEIIPSLLEGAGYSLINNGDHFRTSAVYRGGSNQFSIKVYKESGRWIDFGSGDMKSGFIEDLIYLTTGERIKVNKQKVDHSFTIKTYRFPTVINMEKYYPDSSVRKLLPQYDFFEDRDISSSTLKMLECGLATQKTMYQRVVFPIRRSDGKIHGFTGRNVNPNNQYNKIKWLHRGESSSWIYPYMNFRAKDIPVDFRDGVFVVESIGDALKFIENGKYNVVVSFGLKLSPKLLTFLASLKCKVYIAYNNIKLSQSGATINASVSTYTKLSKFISFENIIFSPANEFEDFGDYDDSSLLTYYREATNRSAVDSTKEMLEYAHEYRSTLNKTRIQECKKIKKKILSQ